MKLPRDLSGRNLAKLLKLFGYDIDRQTGSHIRLTTTLRGEHHITIPDHASLRVGTLSGICQDISDHLKTNREEVLKKLFSK